jgi:thymidylate kinase
MEYKGIPYYDTDTILDNAGNWRNIRVASGRDSAMSAFLKECLTNGKDRKRYAIKAAEHYNLSPEYFHTIFVRYFGLTVANDFANFFGGDMGADKIQALCLYARKALWLMALQKSPLTAFRYRLVYHYQRFSRIFRAPGIAVAFLGTDGAGKTTIIERIKPTLSKTMHNAIRFEHMRPNLLPSLARLFGKELPSGPVTNPHGSPPSGFVGSILRLGYYTCDYVIGFWLKIYPAMVKRPCIFIFDRYFYDYLFDPVRARMSLPKWIIKLFSFAIPKPDLILCLGADPEVIHIRKPELPIEETKKQVANLRQFCSNTARAIWIDTGRPVEDAADKTLKAIAERMAGRYQKINGGVLSYHPPLGPLPSREGK